MTNAFSVMMDRQRRLLQDCLQRIEDACDVRKSEDVNLEYLAVQITHVTRHIAEIIELLRNEDARRRANGLAGGLETDDR